MKRHPSALTDTITENKERKTYRSYHSADMELFHDSLDSGGASKGLISNDDIRFKFHPTPAELSWD